MGCKLLPAEADGSGDKGTEWQRDKVMSLAALFSALCLCAFATLCLHLSAKAKLKSSPGGERFLPFLNVKIKQNIVSEFSFGKLEVPINPLLQIGNADGKNGEKVFDGDFLTGARAEKARVTT